LGGAAVPTAFFTGAPIQFFGSLQVLLYSLTARVDVTQVSATRATANVAGAPEEFLRPSRVLLHSIARPIKLAETSASARDSTVAGVLVKFLRFGWVLLDASTFGIELCQTGTSTFFPATNNTAVNLLVNGIAGGNAQIGRAVSNPDGSITLTLKTSGSADLLRWLLSFGSGAEVLSPPALRALARAELETALSHYKATL